MTDADSAKLARRTTIAAVACVVGVGGRGGRDLGAAALAGADRGVAADDVHHHADALRRLGRLSRSGGLDAPRGLDAGGVNAATPLLRALGRDGLPSGVDRGALLERLGVDPGDESSVFKPLREFVRRPTRGRPRAPPATMAWLRARCRAAEANQVRSGASARGSRSRSGAGAPPVGVAGGEPVRPGPARPGANTLTAASTVKSVRRRRGRVAMPRGPERCCRATRPQLGRRRRNLEARAAAGARRGRQRIQRRARVLAGGPDGHRRSRREPGDQPRSAVGDAGPPVRQARLSARDRNVDVPPPGDARCGRYAASAEAAPGYTQGGGPMARAGTAARLEAINQQFDALDVAMQAADPKQRIAQVDQAAPAAGEAGRRPQHGRGRDPGRFVRAARVDRDRAGAPAAGQREAARVARRARRPSRTPAAAPPSLMRPAGRSSGCTAWAATGTTTAAIPPRTSSSQRRNRRASRPSEGSFRNPRATSDVGAIPVPQVAQRRAPVRAIRRRCVTVATPSGCAHPHPPRWRGSC